METLAPLLLTDMSVNVSVVTGHPTKKWKERKLSGLYSIVETVNDRPVYKVRFIFLILTIQAFFCDNRIL